ncbi:MAG: hypothetical protein H6901_09910 [Rhodobacteraceae bacterium]|nr:hypothetical protein [Paracoccaceae bacterium]MCP5342517.1 hypothetical protein [Paracoccaceae bacterium]
MTQVWHHGILDVLFKVLWGIAMAFKSTTFYYLDSGVGAGMPNARPDVMLVQFFLKELMNHMDFKPSRPTGADITVDGKFGNQTETWIRAFQAHLKSKGKAVVVDGKVSPARGYQAKTATNTPYTLAHMNASFRKRWRGDHDNLDQCSRVPPEIRAALGDYRS